MSRDDDPTAGTPPRPGDPAYEAARERARHADPSVRRELAARPDLPPEILYFLAKDDDAEVRRLVAGNLATPSQASRLLATDANARVREGLAEKIARLLPSLSGEDYDRLYRMTCDTLKILARDQVTKVRQILAETLKDVANAPPEVVRQLAHDEEIAVAAPVLEFSLVLTDEDLLEIVESCPTNGALSSISRRSLVSPDVSAAIAATEDVDAIAVLLANPSAQIREETLDMLLDRAPMNEQWHEPLVLRPQITSRIAVRLARIVAEHLLDRLAKRADIDAATKAAVATVVRRRVEEGGLDTGQIGRKEAGQSAQRVESQIDEARRLHDEGRLEEGDVLLALDQGRHDFVHSALAARSGLPLRRIRQIAAARSAKGMTALAWRAGLSMTAAVVLQSKLAKLGPTELLNPRPGSRGFPLSIEEMSWQLELFGAMVEAEKLPPVGKKEA